MFKKLRDLFNMLCLFYALFNAARGYFEIVEDVVGYAKKRWAESHSYNNTPPLI
jgi:hypothetical protein